MKENENENIVIFDLDGTLVDCQSQELLAFYLHKKGYIKLHYLLLVLFWFFLYKAGLVKDPSFVYKKAVKIFKGISLNKISPQLELFYEKILKKKLNKQLTERLDFYKDNNYRILLLSTAVAPLASKVAEKLNLEEVIATKIKIEEGRITGEIDGEIVYGEQKIPALLKILTEKQVGDSVAYADHYSDLPLLKKTKEAFLVNPSRKTFELLKKQNLDIEIIRT